MAKAVSAFDHLLADTTFKYHRDVDRIMRSLVDELSETLHGLVDRFDAPGSSQMARPKRRESNINSTDFVDGAAPGSAPLVLCLMRLFALTRYFDLAHLDDEFIEMSLKVLEARKDELFMIVGPRSAHFAAQITARLLCYRMNSFAVDAGLDTSHISETQENYDLKEGEGEEGEEEMADSQATPSRRTRSRKTSTMNEEDDEGQEESTEATPSRGRAKKTSKKKEGPKLYGSVSVPKVPEAGAMNEVARAVHTAIEYCHHLLDRTADDSDVADMTSYGAFIALCHLLSTFCPSIENTPLKPLAYHCSPELEDAMGALVEAEMERASNDEDDDLESRLLLVLNFYYRLITIGVFGADGADKHVKRCIAQLKSPHQFVSKSTRQMLAELRASTYNTPALISRLIVDTLEYAFELTPAGPQSATFDEAKLQKDVVALAKQLAKSFGPASIKNSADACKLILDMLVKSALKAPEDKTQLIAWAAAPFVSKLSPAAARELQASWARHVDHMASEVPEETRETYEDLKALVAARASGRRAKTSSSAKHIDDTEDDMDASQSETQARSTPKRAAKRRNAPSVSRREDDSDDEGEEEEFKAPKPRTPKKTPAKTPTKAAESGKKAKRSSAVSATSRTSTSVMRQGVGDDNVSVTEDSEMAHTDDDMSEAEVVKPRGASTARQSTSSGQLAGESDSADELEEEEEHEVPESQASVEITMDQLLEPPSTRPKRARSSRLSQSSVAASSQGDDESEAQISDSDDALMAHTPSSKKRAPRK